MGRRSTEADFWAKTIPEPMSGCLLWLGGVDRQGYGKHGWKGRPWVAHRLAWSLIRGPIPPGLFVCHKCDNPSCVEPQHLFLGTAADNAKDRHSKGRDGKALGEANGSRLHPERLRRGDENPSRSNPERLARGDRHWSRLHPEKVASGDANGSRTHPERLSRGEHRYNAKLNEEKVRAIRAAHQAGQTIRSLARAYSVHPQNIRNVVNRRTWSHVL